MNFKLRKYILFSALLLIFFESVLYLSKKYLYLLSTSIPQIKYDSLNTALILLAIIFIIIFFFKKKLYFIFSNFSSGNTKEINYLIISLTIALVLKFIYIDYLSLVIAPRYIDFPSFFGSVVALKMGLNIYSLKNYLDIFSHIFQEPREIYPYIYPPFFSVLIYPLSFFNYYSAASLWNFLNLVFLSIGIIYTWKFLKPCNEKKGYFLILLLLIVIINRPISICIEKGQVDILVFMLFAFSFYLLKKERTNLGSLIFAGTILIKLYTFEYLIYFLLKKEWKILLKIILMLIFLTLVTLLFSGYENSLVYINEILPNFVIGKDANFKFNPFPLIENQSISSILYKSLYGESNAVNSFTKIFRLRYLVLIVNLLVWIPLILIFYKNKEDTLNHYEISLVLVAIFLTSPLLWSHTPIIMIFPYLILASYILKLEKVDMKLIILSILSFLLMNTEIDLKSYSIDFEIKEILFSFLSFRLYSILILYYIFSNILMKNPAVSRRVSKIKT